MGIIKKLIRAINDMKMKNKLILFYCVFVMLPVLVVGISLTSYYRREALSRAIDQATNNVAKIKSQMSSMLTVPTNISSLLVFDSNLSELVNTRYESPLQLTKAYHAYEVFDNYVLQYQEISNIRFFIDNPTLVDNMSIAPINDEIRSSIWYNSVLKNKGTYWLYIPDKDIYSSSSTGSINKLSLIRQVNYQEYKRTGILMIQMKPDVLARMLYQEPFETLVADQQGYIAAAKSQEQVGRTLDSLDIGVDLSNDTRKVIKTTVKGVNSYVIVDELMPLYSISKLKIISVFATEDIVRDANRVSALGLGIILGVLVVALGMVNAISFLMTKRLLRLSRQLNQVALGNFSVLSNIDGNDEIGQLSRQFNYMVGSINQLIERVVETNERNNKLELAQKEIKFKMMASQINPHFLFNALESIRMNAHIKGEKEIANTVRLLGKLMRKNLEVGRDMAPIKDEIEMVRSYLEIQKFRYEDRLAYTLNVDPDCMATLIPPLIVQPLVENSVIHGLENKEGTVQVKVCILCRDEYIDIRVSDDGAGMTEARLEEIRSVIGRPEEESKNRIGLRNVHQRLVLYYGEGSGLHIDSREGEGTTIEFSIPRVAEPIQ
ncbi:sensor histidine kinase [Paenibacillus glufosinatiresistens]|uniref:sensor histidine kinase n=1 Tax=Paenibacillus glufosinatiresistens TaxID=3070657 RepID=UPI00286EA178|nr:sensor histidine kinase [Paenibacillus sp. YX.27]